MFGNGSSSRPRRMAPYRFGQDDSNAVKRGRSKPSFEEREEHPAPTMRRDGFERVAQRDRHDAAGDIVTNSERSERDQFLPRSYED